MGIQQLLFVKSISDFVMTISANQLKLNLATWASANGWNGTSAAVITIASNVFIYSNSTATAALTTESFPGGLIIINNGSIIGMGGKGGDNTGQGIYQAAQAGGPAMSLSCNCSIDNTNGLIGGGGGGGGGGYGAVWGIGGGGGAGGGAGGGSYGQTWGYYAGGAGGAPDSNGSAPPDAPFSMCGGGGGRIKAATNTAGPSATAVNGESIPRSGFGGSGGGTGICLSDYAAAPAVVTGGMGGGVVSGGSGSITAAGQAVSGGGGGYGAAGGNAQKLTSPTISQVFNGAAGGKSVNRNGYTPTWIAVGARYGTDS